MNQHQQQFAQQLAIWTGAIIDNGRTPFRRVDTYPPIDTDLGLIRPPLVLWINRQSMMAGGVLLLPEDNLKTELERGRSCATALGLRNFVTWETDQVRIWQVEKETIKEQQTFLLTDPDHSETFRYLLDDLLDALKLPAILGAIPVPKLSSYYINNLFQITLQQALPPLIKAYRSQRSEMDRYSPEDANLCANEVNRLLLLQILVLLWFRKLPTVILPEKMEHAIKLSLSALPDYLCQVLSYKATINPPPLPRETAICFHHLLLRLRQISWDQPKERAKESFQRLATYWYPHKSEETASVSVYLYPETPPLNSTTEVLLSNSPSFLAVTAFLKNIINLRQCKLILGNLFQLERDTLPITPVIGRLLNKKVITSFERREYTTRLRAAWPNRCLKITTGQPFWMWELIHLLGLCHAGQQLSLELPIDSLKTSVDEPVWTLLFKNFSFQKLHLLENKNILLNILRSKKPREPFSVQRQNEIREIIPSTHPACFRNQLLFALILPTDIYKLLGHELIWPDLNELSVDQTIGWQRYSQSHLYKWFQNILQNETTQINPAVKSKKAIRTCIPHPKPLLLNKLAAAEQTNLKNNQLSSIDHFLADLLACPTIKNIKFPKINKISSTDTAEIHSVKKLKETMFQQLSAHGIPNFPEQYLYFLEQPKMRHYSLTPPLTVKSNLLGHFELEDVNGRIIAGYGSELEQTLLLCSELEKTEIDLPIDRHQLELLLQHYQKDLKSLYKYLNNLCYSQVETSKSARKLIKKTWEKLNLPEPLWFKN